MFQWSSLSKPDSLLNDEDECLEWNSPAKYPHDAEASPSWDDGEPAERETAANMASHALLSREEEQQLAHALQQAFLRIQQCFAGFPNLLVALTDHLCAKQPDELDDTIDQLLTLVDLLGVHRNFFTTSILMECTMMCPLPTQALWIISRMPD